MEIKLFYGKKKEKIVILKPRFQPTEGVLKLNRFCVNLRTGCFSQVTFITCQYLP